VIARAALRIAAFFYGLGARFHRAFMRWRAPGRGRLSCAVVSVGGLSVGGAGKTPLAARIASDLHQRGWRVVLASRGYKGRAKEAVTVVSDGAYIHSKVALSGDEAFVLTAHAPGVPVLVGRDRRIVGHHAVSAFDAQILVLDDAFSIIASRAISISSASTACRVSALAPSCLPDRCANRSRPCAKRTGSV